MCPDAYDYDVVADGGADPSGNRDATAVINEAIARFSRVYIPAGLYKIGSRSGSGLVMRLSDSPAPAAAGQPAASRFNVSNGKQLFGAGTNATTLFVETHDTIGISVLPDAALSNCAIGDLTITRSRTPAATADGLVVYGGLNNNAPVKPPGYPGMSNDLVLYNITCSSHFNGFNLGPTAYSVAQNCIAISGFGHGFVLTNAPNGRTAGTNPSLQWSLINTFSANNEGWGYLVQAYSPPWVPSADYPEPPFITFNTWYYPYTFNNSMGGICVKAMVIPGRTGACSINDFTVIGAWLDQDGNLLGPPGGLKGPGILLNTNGGTHRIIDCHIEFSGTYGILIDGLTGGNPNGDVQISGSSVLNSGRSGIAAFGPAAFAPYPTALPDFVQYAELMIEGCRITRNNATPGPVGANFGGIDLANVAVSPSAYLGSAMITGCRIGGDVARPIPRGMGGVHAHAISATPETFIAGCDLTRNGPGPSRTAIVGAPNPASGNNRLV
jgi:hypothetical protein